MSVYQTEAQERMPDRPGVPYFETPGIDGTESLPLKSTQADVQISGGIARVLVKQVFQNRGQKPIEAVYVFPGSTRSAIHSLTMKIGDRTISAKIEERLTARNEYNQAVNEGHTASLLEQQRPNVFQMNVGNIMPGDLVEVSLAYTETLIPSEGLYEFVYPTVVGPRYSSPFAGSVNSDGWNANPYLHEGELPACAFGIEVHLSPGIPIRDLRSTSHNVNIDYSGKNAADVSLGNREIHGSNRDFILQYRLGGQGIESGIWLYGEKDEHYFMATIQPPARVEPKMLPPREYIFIVDVSGSMSGFPLEVSTELISEILGGLSARDCFNILFFAGGSKSFAEHSVPAIPENINDALRMLESQSGGGGTELLPALKKALAMGTGENYARTFVIATDGYVSVEKEAFSLIRSSLNKASFFAFGIGSSVNRYLIEGLAIAGKGESFIVTERKEARKKAGEFRRYISSPVLSGIKLSFEGFDVFDVEPVSIPDLFASRPVFIYGKYRGNPSGKIRLTGRNGKGEYSMVMNVADAVPSRLNESVKYLWAREKIRMLDDFSGSDVPLSDNNAAEVTRLGLKYNLLTAYTSFVAIDSGIRNSDGSFVSVRQVLPLPEGVSNNAVQVQASGLMIREKAENRKHSAVGRSLDVVENSDEAVFAVVETAAEFPGGKDALQTYFRTNLNYPGKAKNAGIHGTVFVSFTVEADGSIAHITIVKGIGYGCDQEALRLVKQMPRWIPGKHRGRAVKTLVNLPVQF